MTTMAQDVKVVSLKISSITAGKRHRKDMGDISGLAQSITDVGLLHPIVVNRKRELVAGKRRMEAFKSLGRPTIPATVIDLEKVVRGEYAENSFRKAFTPTEMADIADAIEPIEREDAKARQVAAGERGEEGGRGKKKTLGGISPKGLKRGPRALDKVARVVGRDRKTITKARAVRDAALQHPEKFGKLQTDMDRTGNVNGPFKRLKVMTQAAAIRKETPPLPGHGPYRVIVVDPPWPYETRQEDPSHRAVHDYPTMSIEQICKVDVASIAHKDCVLWLWCTNHHLIRFAGLVLDAWGFQEKTILTWGKDRFGTGDWLRGQSEHCIMAVRGKPTITLTNQSTLFLAPMRRASEKPPEFYPFVEKLCPAPRYASIFHREGLGAKWDGHGDEVKPTLVA